MKTKEIDIERYNDMSISPISIRIAAQTIGLDIVSVKPMSSPRIDTAYYIDFKYKDKTYIPKKEIKRVYSEIDPYGEEDWDE